MRLKGGAPTMPLKPATLPAWALVSEPLNCRNWKPNVAPRQPTSFSASTPRPTISAWLLVHPPGCAPPATMMLVSASHRPPSLMPHSSFKPSLRPSQPLPTMPKSVAAGLPLTATGVWPTASAATVESAIALMIASAAGRRPPSPPKRRRPDCPKLPRKVPNATVYPKTLRDPARPKSICAGGALLHQEMIKTLAAAFGSRRPGNGGIITKKPSFAGLWRADDGRATG